MADEKTPSGKKSIWKNKITWIIIAVVVVIVALFVKRSGDNKKVKEWMDKTYPGNKDKHTEVELKAAVAALKKDGKIWKFWFNV